MNLRRNNVETMPNRECSINRESTFDINNLKYEFKVDKERFTVEYGGMKFRPIKYTTPKSILDSANIAVSTGVGYKEFNDKYGITAKVLSKCVNREFKEAFVTPVEKHFKRYCFSANSYRLEDVKVLHEMFDVLEQCDKDNLKNVAPICLLYKTDPAGCKTKLGKSLWKKLCKNSYTRNLHIYKIARKYGTEYRKPSNINLLNQFKSKYLKRGKNLGRSRNEVVDGFCKYNLWVSNNGLTPRTVYDTEIMSRHLNEKFSLKWSPTKMQKMHDRYSLALQKQREEELLKKQAEHSKQWEAVERYLPCDTIELDGYVATLIKTPLELHREGEAMHHCVGSYASNVKSGDYLVYSITKDGERVSTLGVNIIKPLKQYTTGDLTDLNLVVRSVQVKIGIAGTAALNQHYGKYNSKIVEETPLQLADLVVESLNKLMKEH